MGKVMTESDATIFLTILGIEVIVVLAFFVFNIIAAWKIFVKAGEKGWKIFIPIYNLYILFKIAWGDGLLFLLLLIPFINLIIPIILMIKLAKSFGQGGGFACGLIFLQPIFTIILGFGRYEYVGPNGVKTIVE